MSGELIHNYEVDCPACIAEKRAMLTEDWAPWLNDPDVCKGLALVCQLSVQVQAHLKATHGDDEDLGTEMTQYFIAMYGMPDIKAARDLIYAQLQALGESHE